MDHRLSIRSQGSLAVEQFSANGQHQMLHYMVKNKTYAMDVALEAVLPLAAPTLTTADVDVVAKLLYDGQTQEVVAIKGSPISYKGAAQHSACYKMEFSLSVLSSHHDDSSFCVELQAVGRESRMPLANVVGVLSQPIHVISKPEVLAKKKAQQLRQEQIAAGLVPPESATGSKRKRAPPKAERMLAELDGKVTCILDLVQRMEDERQAAKLMPEPAATPVAAFKSEPVAGKMTGCKRKFEQVFATSEEEFGHHFRGMLSAFSRISEEDRPLKVRKVMNAVSAEEAERAQELCDAVRLNLPDQPSSQQSTWSQLAGPSLANASYEDLEAVLNNFF